MEIQVLQSCYINIWILYTIIAIIVQQHDYLLITKWVIVEHMYNKES